jgi:hypothetical protein
VLLTHPHCINPLQHWAPEEQAGHAIPLQLMPPELDELPPPPLLELLGPVSSGSSSTTSGSFMTSGSSIASGSSSPELPLLLPPLLPPPPLPLPPPPPELGTRVGPLCARYSIGPSGVPAAAQATIAPRTDVKKAPAEARPYQCILPVYMPDLEQQRAEPLS